LTRLAKLKIINEMLDPKRTILPAKKIVVLEKLNPTGITGSSIEVVTSKMKPDLGKVVAIGEGTQPIPMKVGDAVAYRRYGESAFLMGGKEVLFVGFQDVLAVLK